MVKELWPGHGLLYGTNQGQIIKKPNKQELSSLFMTHRLDVLHAPVKFYKYIPYGLGVMARTRIGTDGFRSYGPDTNRDGRKFHSQLYLRLKLDSSDIYCGKVYSV